MPNFHLGGNWVLLGALYHGACVSIVPTFEPQAVLDAISDHQCTVMPIVPTAMQMLEEHPAIGAVDFSSLHKILYFGSPIDDKAVRKAIATFGCELNQLYGTTETWFATLLKHTEHIANKPAKLKSCGKALPFIDIKICDEHHQAVADGTVGEICIRTPVLNKGYWQKPEATAATVIDGWYHSGDLAWRDNEGYIYLVDRAKDMIVSGGENIYSVEVERAIATHPAVNQVAVIGIPDQKWGEKVIAFVVLNSEATLSAETLQAYCREQIASYKTPKDILFKDSLPMNLTGKIQKNLLRAPYWQTQSRQIG